MCFVSFGAGRCGDFDPRTFVQRAGRLVVFVIFIRAARRGQPWGTSGRAPAAISAIVKTPAAVQLEETRITRRVSNRRERAPRKRLRAFEFAVVSIFVLYSSHFWAALICEISALLRALCASLS